MITRNRCRDVVRSLGYITRLPERPPVIVVDNGSDDGTVDAVGHLYPDVQTVRLEENIGAAARNVGVQRAPTPYVAFADDDSWWECGSLARAAALLDAHENLALVAATVLVGNEREPDPTCVAMARSPLPDEDGLPGRTVLGFLACGAVVRAGPFLAVGGFEQLFGVGGEEKLLAVDLVSNGWAVKYVPDVIAIHEPSTNRNRAERQRTVVRNRLWTAWLRRPARSALAVTWNALTRSCRNREELRGIRDAVVGAPAILARRAPVSPRLDRWLRLLD